ncbi:MAG: hypothetical protein A3F75_07645 [Betaproteobacteria bacterium RIFCSPLOWO2_12_FULL_64_23]|nr:MAG: hypothetical protein A3F75_07645 [Betaproteobacteria bacterium RIFCSPLOWO2_12_FULL_64_23]
MFVSTTTFAAELASQSSEDGGVTIAVKPVDVSAKAATWSFQVSLSTHSQDLNDDLVRTAFIVDRVGNRNALPTGWKGDAPGGHHRKGVLSFKALAPLPAAIELRIQRAGEKAPRMYRWDLDCPCNDPKMHPS